MAPTSPMPLAPEPINVRRARLKLDVNPCRQVDYLVVLTRGIGSLRLRDGLTSVQVEIRYVPDCCTLSPPSLTDYLELATAITWPTPETLSAMVFDDLINEIVPRWLNLTMHFADGPDVIMEERQPQWDNPSLLARLPS